jgi:hypothetical protein
MVNDVYFETFMRCVSEIKLELLDIKNDINKTNERIQFTKDLLVIKINGLKNRIESNTGDKELQNKHKEYTFW